MIVFPKELVATRYPGYFWNVVEKKLYSIKVTGELHPLKFHRGGVYYGKEVAPGYRISVRGERKKLTMAYLGSLRPDPVQQEIQYEF